MGERLRRMWAWLSAPRWPEGEPALTVSGRRFGTVLDGGRIVLAPGFRIERLPEQQADAAPQHHRDSDRVQREA